MIARERLERYRKKAKLTHGELGRILGLKPPSLSRIMHGVRRPNLVLAARIERVTGIAAASWADSPLAVSGRERAESAQARTRRVLNSHVSNVLTGNA